MKWTVEQTKVIELRNRNILVSAAAGSGKTAVLVERIISMISDKEHPVDIDRLLIVTFTKAAAAEMRERILAALEKKREEFPKDLHLERQLTLIHNAQITTIDSFCQYVIRNYFHVCGLDPGFRVADEGELKLIKGDVADRLIEEKYANGNEGYLKFVECYASGKTDKDLEELILQLYHYSVSYPWPVAWLKECKKAYEVESMEEMLNTDWMMHLLVTLKRSLGDIRDRVSQAIDIASSVDGPYMYEEALLSDDKMLEELLSAETYLEYARVFESMGKHARLSSKKDPAVSEAKKEEVKNIREQVKKGLKEWKEQYFYEKPEQILKDMQDSREVMEALLDLTIEFSERFAGRKQEKNLVDFSDLEHFALDILVHEEDGKPVPTQTASELASYYEEILIDEYQDSNLVQELLLTSVSRKYQGQNNLFMVGDVKQSIYRFRLARPELFMEKYESYPLEEGPCQRIDLHRNFRSRNQVLSSVNFIFDQIMAKYLGNIHYNEETALYPGAEFPEGGEEAFRNTELILLDLDPEDETRQEIFENARELEARAVAGRILEIVGKEKVCDRASGTYRPARYSDIVILLRTINGWADTFAEILGSRGIPSYTGSQSGYFSTPEIQTVLSLLKVLDNPRQEIPMAAVLASPIVGLDASELAMLKSDGRELAFYEAAQRYGQKNERVKKFFAQMDSFRRILPFTPMHELLWKLLEETGYGDYAAAMPGGAQRAANLSMLAEKAIAYESSSYRGLYNFIRYIERLKKYNVDFGEASTIGEQEDTVRIMSIHKSKGLEFPIVFVSGMGKSFNQQDSRSKLILHPKLGAGCDCIDPSLRVKTPTLFKKVIQKETADENLGEELRVLYVAFTRAREKLLLTGASQKLTDRFQKWGQGLRRKDRKLPYTQLSGAVTYLDWIMPALLTHPSASELRRFYGIPTEASGQVCSYIDASFTFQIRRAEDLIWEEAGREAGEGLTKRQLLERVEQARASGQENLLRDLQGQEIGKSAAGFFERMTARYPHEEEADIYGKVTVSELKRYSQSLDMEETASFFAEEETLPLVPRFMMQDTKRTGADKGTAYHKLLEVLDFGEESDPKEALMRQMDRLAVDGRLTEEESELIDPGKIVRLLHSELGRRMGNAAKKGQLFREQQFVLGVPSSAVRADWKKDETVLVQGIIDAYFYEDGEIVLVDYKTDYVPDRDPRNLIQKYKIQLDTYAEALKRLTGRKVKQKILYSFWLSKALEVL